jgi:hypothetical protein
MSFVEVDPQRTFSTFSKKALNDKIVRIAAAFVQSFEVRGTIRWETLQPAIQRFLKHSLALAAALFRVLMSIAGLTA